jgi:hypothetical protein
MAVPAMTVAAVTTVGAVTMAGISDGRGQDRRRGRLSSQPEPFDRRHDGYEDAAADWDRRSVPARDWMRFGRWGVRDSGSHGRACLRSGHRERCGKQRERSCEQRRRCALPEAGITSRRRRRAGMAPRRDSVRLG